MGGELHAACSLPRCRGMGIASRFDFHHVLSVVSLSLSPAPALAVTKIKALILMALLLAVAHFFLLFEIIPFEFHCYLHY